MKVQALVNRLESWIQEELQAQRRLLELLGEQQHAIDSGSGANITEVGEKIQEHLRSGPARESRRLRIVRHLAADWGVVTETLTLRSIAERADAAGAATGKLRQLRCDLRDVGAQVLRTGRRLAVLAKYHQGMLAEMLGLLVREGSAHQPAFDTPIDEGGVLLNQRA